ncbi:MAG: nuclear transport factor 2 family protein [Bacteroidetes bacterium]|nr:nuclear transport factor 2 family protein [Bacteroidota bacterium]
MHQLAVYLLFSSMLCMGCRHRSALLSKEEVMQIISKFDKGWETKDSAMVDAVLSPQYLYFTQSGNTFDRASLVATAASDVYTLQSMEREALTLLLEGNTAVVNTVWKGKGHYHGQPFDDRQRCSITIVKHDGKVRILSEHCTPIR